MQIVSREVNELKADKTTFEIDGVIYQVKKATSWCENCCYPEYSYDNKKYLLEIIDGVENYLYSEDEDEYEEQY